ncbi:hypothetical protein [Niallia sp. NCCP-28]|uniref:hypothetical protein n=1 Tax=Niallia sp. NCCP-28 TaxID=2934712 RepID=UPI002087E6E4|nr:hypothetical protein [Niallia sp. NCCP-28]GKU82251.1 hypothetical protein NCCP28_16470 [Niallia sp. NCCP-28]
MKQSTKGSIKTFFLRKKVYITLGVLMITIFIGSYLAIDHFFPNEANSASSDLGEKVIITMPNGKKVYTYENLLAEEEGKLFYKGERNTIDLTGGVVIYKDWK